MNKPRAYRVFVYSCATFLFVFVAAPFLWMIVSSLALQRDLTTLPFVFPPPTITFDRYLDIFVRSGNPIAAAFKDATVNSLIVAFFVTLSSLVVGTLASYAFARLRFRGRKVLLFTLLFTYMVPSIVVILPLYTVMSALGLLDNRVTLIVLYLSLAVPFVVWVMQDYFGSIGQSFEEAALMDGCTRWQTLTRVYLPMSLPGLVATGILAFLLSWDEFFFSLVFTSTLEAKTIPVAIAEFSAKNTIDYGMIATGGVIASLPPLLVTALFQKQIVTGMTGGGVKE
jgi:multiple sugar transport system permease protein